MSEFTGEMGAIRIKGSRPSTLNGNVSAEKAFGSFLAAQNFQDPRWPKKATELTKEQRESPAMFERCAHFYASNLQLGRKEDTGLLLGSAKNYLRANARALGVGDAVQISKIVDKLVYFFVLRAIDEGVDVTSSAPPLYLEQLYKVIEALVRVNDAEASFRASVLLLSYDAVGRGGEVASLCWPLVHWSYDIGNCKFTWSEIKTGKQYPVPLLPHRDKPDGDPYLQMGNAAAHGQFNRGGPPEQGESLPLFSQFSAISGAATKVSDMLKDLATGTSKWPKVPELHGNKKFSSHSIAHGSHCEMSAQGVPPLNQCDLKGHSAGKGVGVSGGAGGAAANASLPGMGSAFWTYHQATPASVAIGKIKMWLLKYIPIPSNVACY